VQVAKQLKASSGLAAAGARAKVIGAAPSLVSSVSVA
jgi:hypothetical protein